MNLLGIITIILGIIYLIYSILFRNKITYYNRSFKIIENKEKDYFRLQLYFSILNSSWLLIVGLLTLILFYSEINFIISLILPCLVAPLNFHIINYIFKIISKHKGYIEYE
ncbi:hypothetical protein SH2C18_34780 [Clostridium sediminicola]|uniref:hypothetical protein n=1 Tax=Clostridium sediminicola TaxID=3114879 RepID=UPI0031F24344